MRMTHTRLQLQFALRTMLFVFLLCPSFARAGGDAYPKSLESPPTTVPVGVPVGVSFIIANDLSDPVLNLSGSISIRRLPAGALEYNKTWTLGAVQPQSQVTVTMTDNWTPQVVGPYDVTISFFALADNNPGNNVAHYTIQSVAPPSNFTNSVANVLNTGLGADPVNLFTGEYFRSEPPDLVLNGPMPIVFSRYYASMLKGDSNIVSALGDNWLHTFDWKFKRAGADVSVTTNRGRLLTFQKSGAVWNRMNSSDAAYQLAEDGSHVLLLDPMSRLVYRFANDRLMQIEDGKGNKLTLTYATNKLSAVSDSLGRTLTFTYDAGGSLISVGDGTRTIQFSHIGMTLTGVTDARGNLWSYSYAGGNVMIGATKPEGNTPYTQVLDPTNRVKMQKDAFNNTTTITYPAAAGGATTLTDPRGASLAQTHTPEGLLTSYTDELGNPIQLSYDGNNRLQSIRDRLTGETVRSYHDQSGYITSMKNAANQTTTFSYSKRTWLGLSFFDLVAISFPDGSSATFTYDAAGNRIQAKDQKGKTTTNTFNNRGQVLTTTNPTGGVTLFTYHPDGMLASIADHAGNTTTFAYDALKRLTTTTNPDASTRTFTYDANDNVLTATDEAGHTTTYTYDKNNRLTSMRNALGNATTFAYDLMDRVTSITDAASHTATIAYDQLGRVQSVTDQTGKTVTYAYDTRGNLASVTDPAGKKWEQAVDAEAILASATDPLGHKHLFESNALGRIERTTSPLAHMHSFAYDPLQRLTGVTDPLNRTRSFQYDERGSLVRDALAGDSIAVSFARNALGLATQLTDPRGKNSSRQYDAMGRLTSITDALGRKTTFEYDSRNRIKRATYPASLGSVDVSYDARGLITKHSFSDGKELNYTYDALGRLLTATGAQFTYDQNDLLASANGIAIERDHAGRITAFTYAPNKTIRYGYNARGFLSEISDWQSGKMTFQYDDAGRRTSVTTQNGITTTYQYDDDDRLTRIQAGSLATIALTRDADGTISSAQRTLPLSPTVKQISRNLTYDDAQQSSAYTHDAKGNAISDGARTFAWNLAGRIASQTTPSGSVTYAYDAFGQRTDRTEQGATRSTVWNYATPLPTPAIVRTGSTDMTYNVFTPDGALVYRINAANNARTFYHFDEMGNTIFTTNDAAAIVSRFAYAPYGQMLDSQNAADEPFAFQGESGWMRDGNGDIYYVRARYYDASIGRFLSRDPIASSDPTGMNPYQYAYDNPFLFIDATGARPTKKYETSPVGGSEKFKFDFKLIPPPSTYDPSLLPSGTCGPDYSDATTLTPTFTTFSQDYAPRLLDGHSIPKDSKRQSVNGAKLLCGIYASINTALSPAQFALGSGFIAPMFSIGFPLPPIIIPPPNPSPGNGDGAGPVEIIPPPPTLPRIPRLDIPFDGYGLPPVQPPGSPPSYRITNNTRPSPPTIPNNDILGQLTRGIVQMMQAVEEVRRHLERERKRQEIWF